MDIFFLSPADEYQEVTMQARYYEVGDLTVVEIKGRIDPEQNKPFRDVCEKELKNKKVVFCLNSLNFTASANITTFFESIQMISDARIVGLKPDFHKLLQLKGIDLKIFTNLSEAIKSSAAFVD